MRTFSILFLLIALPVSAQYYNDVAWIRGGHRTPVNGLEFLPDGRLVSSDGKAVRIWDYQRRLLQKTNPVGDASISCMDISPDGKLIASGGDAIILWDVKTGERYSTIPKEFRDKAYAIDISPNGRYLAVSSGYPIVGEPLIHLYSFPDGEFLTTFSGHTDQINSLIFTSTSDTLISGSQDGSYRFWDIPSRQHLHTIQGTQNFYGAAALSPDGRYLAVEWIGDIQTEIEILDLADNFESRVITYPEEAWDLQFVNTLRFSPNGRYIAATTSDGSAWLWDVPSGRHLCYFGGFLGEVEGVCFTPDSKNLLVGSGLRKDVMVWKEEDWLEHKILYDTLNEHIADFTGDCIDIAYSADGKLVAGSMPEYVIVCDAETGERVARLFADRLVGTAPCVFSPDGRYLAARTGRANIYLWEVDGWKEVRHIKDDPGPGGAIAFTADSRMMVFTNGVGIKFYDIEQDSIVARINDTAGGYVVFSPDGEHIAWGSAQNGIHIWDVASRTLLHSFDSGHSDFISSVEYSPDGSTLVSCGYDGRVILWDAETGKHHWEYERRNLLFTARFSPDGRYILTGGLDSTVIIHDARTGDSIGAYDEYPSSINAIAISPDARYVSIGARDALVTYNARWPQLGATGPEATDQSTVTLTITPNPAGDAAIVHVRASDQVSIHLSLHDLLGVEVLSLPVQRLGGGEHRLELDLHGLPAGMYLARVTYDRTSHSIPVAVVR